jgi:AcrR family transcriptional regulator
MPTGPLTREGIVKAAIDLLDDEGLEGLNMRALGKRLRAVPTAVYWHVRSKREVISLAGDEVWNEIALPDLGVTPWRKAATSMATEFRAMVERHPWLVQAVGSYLVYGPGKARHDDHSLAIYEAAGFTGASAEEASATVQRFVLGDALGPAATAAFKRKLRREGGNPEKRIREATAKAREVASHFPRLNAHLERRSAARGTGSKASFEFGLQVVLDGLEARLGALAKQSSSGNR